MVAASLQTYGINKWPMADDEVLSLMTMGLLHVDEDLFAFPIDHHDKLPRAVPVWHFVQRQALRLVPLTEAGVRIPSVVYGILFSALTFVLAARWRGLWFAAALSIVLNGSQLFVHVAQVNRFYSLPLFLLGLTVTAIWYPRGGLLMIASSAVLAALTVLSHNATVPFFALAFAAAVATWVTGRAPIAVVTRSAAAFSVSVLVYVLYLLPLIRGWYTTGNPTPVLISFAAYLGVPGGALGLLGAWLVLARRDFSGLSVWWLLIAAGTLCLLLGSTFSWNPRYFVFYLPAFWVLAAEAMASVADRLGRGLTGSLWYGCVVMLLLPNLLSHLADGSRHDYRSAAAVVVAQAAPGEPVLSDDAETLFYYLPERLRGRLSMRTKVKEMPASSFLLVSRSNAWSPMPHYRGRRIDVLAEIFARRLDQFSHVVRVYRVHEPQAH